MARRIRYAVVCILVAGSLLPAMPGAEAAGGATVVVMVSPVGPNGSLQAGYRIVKRIGPAACAPRSAETGNAYRCQVKYGYDPCWVMARRTYVACLTAPYSKRVTRLRVGRYQNKGGLGQPNPLPWGLLLANGVHTTYIPNFGKVGKYPIHYSYDEFKTVLVGPIDRSGDVWRIRKAKNVGAFRFRVVGWADITKAYVGEPTRLGAI